ncbi:MAG: SUMF1/EgtB/PvdO family nonheme iron enzyme [Acidobacteria bacterium]|nr:SUMF1/EgtB/PvdO family nonheme iron enzyme [Acidobacteriota bacterium]MBI3426941.1 SUMF1/EgtB/PvdO family nonheme iron enzyme [Acidobacteriota bacterium]
MPSPSAPKVFISYSQESDEHRLRVYQLVVRLRHSGIDCVSDHREVSPSVGWRAWMEERLREADYTLIVCTETYRRRAERREEPGKGLGVAWEAAIITDEIYQNAGRNTRFIPVVFTPADATHIPDRLKQYTWYRVDTDEGCLKLLRHLTHQPEFEEVPLGVIPELRPISLNATAFGTPPVPPPPVEKKVEPTPVKPAAQPRVAKPTAAPVKKPDTEPPRSFGLQGFAGALRALLQVGGQTAFQEMKAGRRKVLMAVFVLSAVLASWLGIKNSAWLLNGSPIVPDRGSPTSAPTIAAAKLQSFAEDLSNGVKLEMVVLSGGTFEMGSDKGNDNEKPKHKVTLSPFAIGKYEVTQTQWKAVMGADNNPSRFKGDDLPVETVSWNDANAFIKRLREKTGNPTYRLPTEAEWEYACRAGSTGAYSFGDDASQLGEYAWFDKNSEGKTHPFGQKKPNAWGLYDMHGNVLEWVQDWYGKDYYRQSANSTDPQGPLAGEYRVLRGGGSWVNPQSYARSVVRHIYIYPIVRDDINGFRVAVARPPS